MPSVSVNDLVGQGKLQPSQSQPQPQKINLYWPDIEHAVAELALFLTGIKYKPHRIIGISRGGIIPAVLLGHKLKCTNVKSIRLQLREGDSRLPYIPVRWNNADSLIVDDLWDTGQTLRHLMEEYSHPLYAVLYHKNPQAREMCIHAGDAVSPDQWLVFPWERNQ